MMEQQVSLPSPASLLAWLGWDWTGESGLSQMVAAHLSSTVLAVRGYTRGKGFTQDENGTWTCAEDIGAVIISAAARSLSNPTADRRVEVGSFNSAPGSAASWSLVEAAVLNKYRRRASAGPAREPDRNLVSIFEDHL